MTLLKALILLFLNNFATAAEKVVYFFLSFVVFHLLQFIFCKEEKN